MDFRKLFAGSLCTLALACTFTSCSDDDNDGFKDGGSTVQLPNKRAFILNEGSYNGNNAGISFYAPNGNASFIDDIYKTQNGRSLGDTGQDIIEYDDYLYVTVYSSNLLVKLNSAGVKLDSIHFTAEEGSPRFMTADDGKIYVTLYSGNVTKINAKTLKKEGMVKVNNNPEGIVEEDGYVYALNGGWGSGNTMSVINTRTFTVDKTVTVSTNPEKILESEGRIFILSYGGDYPNYTYPVEMYNPKTGEVTKVANATNMAEDDGIIYLAYSDTDWSTYTTTTTFSTYNVKTGVWNQTSFLKDAPAELATSSVYGMSVDSDNGDIYICTSSYDTKGDVYRFRKDGSFVAKFESGGVNPKKVVFVD